MMPPPSIVALFSMKRQQGFSLFLLRRFSIWLTVLFAVSLVMISQGQVPPARTYRSPTSIPKAPAVQRLVDLNTASVEMLEALPGIGRTLANAIIAARPFTNVTELARVKGVGEAKAASLRGRVMVSRLPPGYRPPPSAGGFQKTPANIPAKPGIPAAASSVGKVSLNSAPKEVLEKLPGIGPALADAIIAQRPYQTVEDILKVRGIKAGRFERIKNLISAE